MCAAEAGYKIGGRPIEHQRTDCKKSYETSIIRVRGLRLFFPKTFGSIDSARSFCIDGVPSRNSSRLEAV